jgi:ferredoxin
MWYDPFSAQTKQHGCHGCGATTTSCYAVNFNLFPRKLVRKRHRDRCQTLLFCRSCYESDGDLPFLLDGVRTTVAKQGINPERGIVCRRCAQPFLPGNVLYGVLESSLWMSGSCIESMPLAFFCPQCTEAVQLVASLRLAPNNRE